MKRNMFGFPVKIYQESRRQFRIREQLRVKWEAGMNLFSGFGRIRDISATGVMIEATSTNPIGDGTVLTLAPDAALQENFLPSQARVVWSKKKGFLKNNFLCGLEFVNPAEEVLTSLRHRIQSRIADIERTESLKNIINVALFVILIALGLLALRQQAEVHRTIERSNHLMMGSSARQADLLRYSNAQYAAQEQVLAELTRQYESTSLLLAQTESVLAQTQESLTQARAENQMAVEEIDSLKVALTAAQSANLDEQARILIRERDSLQQELAALKAEIDLALQDPQAWSEQSALYHSRMNDAQLKMQDLKYSTLMERIRDHRREIHQAKRRIRELQRQAAQVRREAQIQKDQMALARGNQGFLIKDGRTTGSAAQVEASSAPKFHVDVTLFE